MSLKIYWLQIKPGTYQELATPWSCNFTKLTFMLLNSCDMLVLIFKPRQTALHLSHSGSYLSIGTILRPTRRPSWQVCSLRLVWLGQPCCITLPTHIHPSLTLNLNSHLTNYYSWLRKQRCYPLHQMNMRWRVAHTLKLPSLTLNLNSHLTNYYSWLHKQRCYPLHQMNMPWRVAHTLKLPSLTLNLNSHLTNYYSWLHKQRCYPLHQMNMPWWVAHKLKLPSLTLNLNSPLTNRSWLHKQICYPSHQMNTPWWVAPSVPMSSALSWHLCPRS